MAPPGDGFASGLQDWRKQVLLVRLIEYIRQASVVAFGSIPADEVLHGAMNL